MSPQPAAAASPATSLQKPVSHAIKIINPATNAEVKIEKEVTTPVLAHATPSPTPERIKTPVTSKEEEERLRKEEEERLKKQEEERLQKEEEERLQKEEEERLQKEEEERLQKEEEERLQKAEEERLQKQEEEKRLKNEEEERLKKEEEERLKVEEEERLKKEEEERAQKKKEEQEKCAAEAEVQKQRALESEVKAKESDDETPISTGTPATPESVGSPTIPASVPKIAEKTVKESNIDSIETNDTSVAIAIKNAKFIDDINAIAYPSGINPPVSALNAKAAPGKFKYDAAFLLQFQTVVTAQPTEDWEQRTKSLQDSEDGKRPSANRSASGAGRQGPRTPSMPSNPFAAMGQLGSMDMSNPVGLNRTPSFGKMGNSTAQLSNMISSMSGMRNNRQGTVRGKRPGVDRTPSMRGDGTPTYADGGASGTSTPVEEKVEPLQLSANRWTARRKTEPEEEKAPDGSIIYPPDVVQRKVNSMLNKMTLEKFDKISDQILEIVAQARWETNGRTLRQVITLTFEKATDEAHWSNMYARFCKKVQESLGDEIFEEGVLDKNGDLARGGALFRKYLLSKCQEQFEKGWKVNDETAETTAEVLTEEYYKVAAIKRKGLGLVRFVGELYILDMLSEKIMHRCIQNLLVAHPSEEEVESLCGLLRTIGAKLDNDRFHREHVDIYFSRMKDILEKEKLSSRIKFMIMDIFDLRKAQWKTKNDDKGPKTIQQIHEEALKEQAIKELAKARTSSVRFR
ncbi:armadillo-type protein [Lipomyces starkeyi]